MVASKQNGLVASLRERAGPGRLFYVPVSINKGAEEAVEYTQRTRSLLFATLALIVARMFRRNDLRFYENGVVSINLPIVEHVLGARASRTTHPRFFTDCSRLFSLLLSDVFTVRNPYIWKTKSDVARVITGQKCGDLISETLSCTRVREATRTNQHCGVCSQCVDRRFGILAAGLGAHDPPENYVVDILTDELPAGSALTMIESYVARAQTLAAMSQQAFASSYGQIFRAVPHLPGSADENVTKLWDLHRRHGQEVVSVIDRRLQANATLSDIIKIGTGSLLAMIISPIAKQPNYVDPAETEPPASARAAADAHDYSVDRIRFAVDPDRRRVIFQRGIELGGNVFTLFAALLRSYEVNLDAAIPTDDFRFVKARKLSAQLGIDEQSLRQAVSRARRRIGKTLLTACNIELDAADVIQNRAGKGYRLNPYLLLVKPAQLRQEAGLSQARPPDATPSRLSR